MSKLSEMAANAYNTCTLPVWVRSTMGMHSLMKIRVKGMQWRSVDDVSRTRRVLGLFSKAELYALLVVHVHRYADRQLIADFHEYLKPDNHEGEYLSFDDGSIYNYVQLTLYTYA